MGEKSLEVLACEALDSVKAMFDHTADYCEECEGGDLACDTYLDLYTAANKACHDYHAARP